MVTHFPLRRRVIHLLLGHCRNGSGHQPDRWPSGRIIMRRISPSHFRPQTLDGTRGIVYDEIRYCLVEVIFCLGRVRWFGTGRCHCVLAVSQLRGGLLPRRGTLFLGRRGGASPGYNALLFEIPGSAVRCIRIPVPNCSSDRTPKFH